MLASLGFSLDEVKEILSEENLKELSQRKLGELDKKCEDLVLCQEKGLIK